MCVCVCVCMHTYTYSFFLAFDHFNLMSYSFDVFVCLSKGPGVKPCLS